MPAYDPLYTSRLLLSFVPEEIRKSLSSDELHDRLLEAARLGEQAKDPRLSADLRKAAAIRSRALLTAQPREVTRQQHAALIAKASVAKSQMQAAAIRREADRLIEELHPIAPPRAGAKGRAGQPVRAAKAAGKSDDDPEVMAVFDESGNLIGIVDPGDVTPVAGQRKPPAPQQIKGVAPVPAPDDTEVAKSGQVHVWGQGGQRYRVSPQRIMRRNPVRKGARVAVYDQRGKRLGMVDPDTIDDGTASPEAQARNTGPVKAGGTTGMGQPRRTGPAGSYPADGPQRALPGDVEDREVIKSAVKALGPNYRCVYDWTGSLVGAVRQSDIRRAPAPGTVAKSAHLQSHANVYNARRQKVGVARLGDIIPVANLRCR